MKKVYEAPEVEIELYELDKSIASHCGIVVHTGPALGKHEQCSDYKDPFGVAAASTYSNEPVYNVQFYEDTNCDCYTTGGDYGYWQS